MKIWLLQPSGEARIYRDCVIESERVFTGIPSYRSDNTRVRVTTTLPFVIEEEVVNKSRLSLSDTAEDILNSSPLTSPERHI